jgi:hypothetical protein
MPGPDIKLLRLKALKDALIQVMKDHGVNVDDEKIVDIDNFVIDTDKKTIEIKYVIMDRPVEDDQSEYRRGYNDGLEDQRKLGWR